MKLRITEFLKEHFSYKYSFLVFFLLFIALVVTRFYDLGGKSVFGYDQVDNAWAAKNIIVDHVLPTIGMQAKGNTGFFIGPYYYYLLVPFYYLLNLNPIASGFVAGFTAIFTFFVTYFVTKNIFNEKVAIAALFITVFSSYILELDRVQWPVNFMVPVSFLVFFSLYKVCCGSPRYLLLLAAALGFSLHIHFTSIFYILILIFLIPFLPRKKATLIYSFYSLLVFIFFVFPIIVNYINSPSAGNAAAYLGSSFHGFHLRRFIQIAGDGLIEFNSILNISNAIFVSIISILVFIFALKKKILARKGLFLFMSFIWIAIPWVIFSTYSGELTNYYFGLSRPIAIFVFAYLLFRIWSFNSIHVKGALTVALILFAYVNILHFLNTGPVGLTKHRKEVLKQIKAGQKIDFMQGNPQSYIYYYYTQIKK